MHERGVRGPKPPRLWTARSYSLLTANVILVVVVVAHAPLRHSEYVQDDHLAVEQNEIVERGRLAEIFSTSYWEGAQGNDRRLYRPAAILSYAIERKLTGVPDALVSQVGNVILHVLAALALGLVLRRLGAGGLTAGSAATLFAIHPIHRLIERQSKGGFFLPLNGRFKVAERALHEAERRLRAVRLPS